MPYPQAATIRGPFPCDGRLVRGGVGPMPQLVPWLLVIHVMSAIIAFGPTYAFAIYGAQGGKEPQHVNFMVRTNHFVSDRLVLPVALTMPISGVLLIWAAGIDLFAAHWLLLAILIYIFAISFSVLVQRQATIRLEHLTATPPPPGAGAGGPPPAVLATVKQIRQGGMLLGLLVLIIVTLMVVKPSF
jgi:uncharacterized membrane protein